MYSKSRTIVDLQYYGVVPVARARAFGSQIARSATNKTALLLLLLLSLYRLQTGCRHRVVATRHNIVFVYRVFPVNQKNNRFRIGGKKILRDTVVFGSNQSRPSRRAKLTFGKLKLAASTVVQLRYLWVTDSEGECRGVSLLTKIERL